MNQLAIDFSAIAPETRARTSDPATSHAAAKSSSRWAASHAGRIFVALVGHGPRTVDELSAIVGLQSQQINKRLPELERLGLALPTDELRPSRSGHQERVWRAA